MKKERRMCDGSGLELPPPWLELWIFKVPKHENFLLSFFALREPIWVGYLGTDKKKTFFFHLTPDFDGFCFFAAY
jgi:hypothetical protein